MAMQAYTHLHTLTSIYTSSLKRVLFLTVCMSVLSLWAYSGGAHALHLALADHTASCASRGTLFSTSANQWEPKRLHTHWLLSNWLLYNPCLRGNKWYLDTLGLLDLLDGSSEIIALNVDTPEVSERIPALFSLIVWLVGTELVVLRSSSEGGVADGNTGSERGRQGYCLSVSHNWGDMTSVMVSYIVGGVAFVPVSYTDGSVASWTLSESMLITVRFTSVKLKSS